MAENTSPALDTAKEMRGDGASEIVTLTTGYRARISAVGANLIEQVQARVQDPEVPIWHNEDKGRDEENPNDPAYLKALAQAQSDRAAAAMDAMIMFGVDLVDGLPEDDVWVKRLRWLERRGDLSLEGYDLDDELDREFLFKKYIAVGLYDLQEIGSRAGFQGAGVEAARRSFPGRAARDSDRGVSAQEHD